MIIIDENSKTPLYLQIYYHYKEEISTGKIQEGSILPSTRALAKRLKVGRNTVENAYQQLYAEGYVSSKMGSGYKVEKIESELYNEFVNPTEQTIEKPLKSFHEQGAANPNKYNFQYGRLSIEDFPLRTWRKLLNQVLLSNDIHCLTAYNERKGQLDLRLEIMKYLLDSRGVRCQPEQIIISSGTLPSLSLICQLLMKDSRDIAVEEPCYDSARYLFLNHDFNVIPIQTQEDGIDLEMLNETSSKALYINPSHQFPTGTVTAINKRLALLEWAEKNDAYIIEDDYDSEYRYNSRPIPSLQSLDNKGRVIYLNTLSKSFAPSLRMSYIVLPSPFMEKYQLFFHKYNCSVSWLEQSAMYRFMNEGHWNRHLRKIYQANRKKHDILIETITELMCEKVKIYGKNSGLHILLEVNNGLTEKELIEKAKSVGVVVYPVSNYWADPKKYSNNMILIGFSGLSENDIVEGLNLLNTVWF